MAQGSGFGALVYGKDLKVRHLDRGSGVADTWGVRTII